ncbi:MAG: hypothetical protein NT159_12730 [Proteobacteria bacterium]|nr:hypothetical protein [Pseudomonadota bacterium]
MSKQNPKDPEGKVLQNTEAPAEQSAELKAALAQFASILEKAVLLPINDDESSPEKHRP